MKCVALLLFVLLVQSVDKFFKAKHGKLDDVSPVVPKPDQRIPDYIDQPNRHEKQEDLQSTLNTTQGILIPDNLLLPLPLSEISSNLMTSFHTLQHTLSDVSGCQPKIVSSAATGLFALLDKIAGKIGSLNEDRLSLTDDVSEVFRSIKDVIFNLNMGTSMSDGVGNIETHLLILLNLLGEVQDSRENMTQIFNDAVFALIKSVQVVIASISLIAEAAGLQIVTAAIEAQEVVISLALLLQTVIVFVQSICSSIGSIVSSLPDIITPTSSVLNSFLWILDSGLPYLTNSVSSITSRSVTSSMALVVSTICVTLTSFTHRVSQSIEKLQASIVLEIPDTLEVIMQNVISSEIPFAGFLTTAAESITSSITTISSSDSGIQSQIARQLYPVFQSLSQLTGSDSEIAAIFAGSLSNIYDVLVQSANKLIFTIGPDLTKSLVTAIEDIFKQLQKMANLVIQETIDATEMNKIAVDCTKGVQVFESAVVGIWQTICRSISTVNANALESVIALPIFHSAILYSVEWVSTVASSVFLTKTGKNHDLSASLAVTLILILKHITIVDDFIARSTFNHHNPHKIVSILKAPVNDIPAISASLAEISKVSAKSSVKIEQMTSISDENAVEGIVSTAEGNLSEILNGLTGSLSPIPLSLNSSISSLQSSLKQIASSKYDLLQTFSSAFNSIATDLSDMSGTANQILQLTSKSLHSIFGRLMESASRLKKMGDLVASLIASIASISSALHSLLYAIKDYKFTACYLIDSSRDIAKTVQILISILAAIFNSAAKASSDVRDTLAIEIAAFPYLVSTVILVVQHVLGAAIPSVSAESASMSSIQHDLTLAMSRILETLTSITSDVTAYVTDGSLVKIVSKISTRSSNLQDYTSASLSKLSGVVANIKVTLGSVKSAAS